ncbi:TATA box-binding protein-like protein 1 [Tetranychus urticae]|uniref:TATA box-binding protein-like protein 1 n=1 Tax=Tetranychus urticae TaxID=32264 RepID=UPI00077BFCD0|nr:TATA box-binding protein-like protein 1 [Tetranychus urticae]
MSSSSLSFTIANIVSLWKIDGQIKLEIDNSKRKKKFNAQVIRRNGVFLVFASGKVIATGFKEVTKAGATLQQIYPDNAINFVKVVNITAHSFLPYTFNVREMIDSYEDTTYEPEIYPAVYIKLNGLTLIYYSTGSIIITGAKELSQIDGALDQFSRRTSQMGI